MLSKLLQRQWQIEQFYFPYSPSYDFLNYFLNPYNEIFLTKHHKRKSTDLFDDDDDPHQMIYGLC